MDPRVSPPAAPNKGLRKVLSDLFTGPDGETWHLGRFCAVPTLTVGLAIPIVALLRDQPVPMTDVGVLLTGIAGAVLLLVRGTKNVDEIDPPAPPPAS